MFKFEIISPPKFSYDSKIIENIFETIKKEIPKAQNGILNIVFISSDEIKNLNNTYRQKDYVTDVLSFHYYESFDNLKNDDVVGELVFCEEKIYLQAKEYGLGEEKEFYKLLIHAILHILGYDHENDDDYKKMSDLENIIWGKIFEN